MPSKYFTNKFTNLHYAYFILFTGAHTVFHSKKLMTELLKAFSKL